MDYELLFALFGMTLFVVGLTILATAFVVVIARFIGWRRWL
jgi:hypothetical protein